MTNQSITAEKKVSGIKLMGFDFDNTIVRYHDAVYSWELVSKALGQEEERKKMYVAYHKGEFDYLTWARRSVDLFKKGELTKQTFDDLFTDEMELMGGVRKLFDGLKRKGIKSAIISGGISNAYDIFAEKSGIKADYVNMAHKLIFDPDGKLVDGSVSELDYDGKIIVLQDICTKLGITMQECGFVGDQRNDIPIFKKVKLPVAINTDNDEIRAAAYAVIENNDISEVLKYV